MARNTHHELLTTPAADVAARQRFVLQFKRQVETLKRRSRLIYEQRLKPELEKTSLPASAVDNWVLSQLYEDNLYQAICALKLVGQDLMWAAIEDALEPEVERITQLFEQLSSSEEKLGSLNLNDSLNLSFELKNSRIHRQPEGYLANKGESDVMAGALYEEGGALYSRGQSVGLSESKAECVIRFLAQFQPNFAPLKILDIGCSVGASSTPYALAFPNAEVHAIDVAPAMLRYAHARAELLQCPVHFHQMDTASIAFEDQSFDLIVSHNAMHEMSSDTQAAMFAESYRLLKPGGLCVHQDVPIRFEGKDSFDKANLLYDKWFNGELFWSDYADNDCQKLLLQAGFSSDAISCQFFAQLDSSISWYLAVAQKPTAGDA